MAAAQKLTNLIKQIIEFAKMVPGFMKLNQDDQIVLLKKGKHNSSSQSRNDVTNIDENITQFRLNLHFGLFIGFLPETKF